MNQQFIKLRINTDGGSRNNPGHAAIGFVIATLEGETLAAEKKYIGIATNNEAEYQAMLSGLTHVRNFFPQCQEIDIYADSELMIKQLNGEYKIREEHLKRFAEAIKVLIREFSVANLHHVLRTNNKAADKLVNAALDERQS